MIKHIQNDYETKIEELEIKIKVKSNDIYYLENKLNNFDKEVDQKIALKQTYIYYLEDKLKNSDKETNTNTNIAINQSQLYATNESPIKNNTSSLSEWPINDLYK